MYTPEKVFILENGSYIELSYEEFCYRRKTDTSFKDKLFIPLHGMIMEVSKAEYCDFYRKRRRQKYIAERTMEKKDVSYDMLSTDEFDGEEILIDDSEDIATEVVHKITLEQLRYSLAMLSEEEQRLIHAIYYDEMTEREYAEQEGICRNAIHKRKVRILAKIKKFMEK